MLILSLLAFLLWLPLLYSYWTPSENNSRDKSYVKIKSKALFRAVRLEKYLHCSLGAAESLKFSEDEAELLDIEDSLTAAAVYILNQDIPEALTLLRATVEKKGDLSAKALECCLFCSASKKERSWDLEAEALKEIFKIEDVNKKILLLEALRTYDSDENTGSEEDAPSADISSAGATSADAREAYCPEDYPVTIEAYETDYRDFQRDVILIICALIFVLAALVSGAVLVCRDAKNLLVWLKTGAEPPDKADKPQIPAYKYLPSLYLFVFINWLSVFLTVLLGLIFGGVYHSRIIRIAALQIFVYAFNLGFIAYKLPQLTVENTDNEAVNQADKESGRPPVTVRSLCASVGLGSIKKAYFFEGLAGYGLAIASAALLSSITSIFLETAPRSENILIKYILNGNIYEFAALFILVTLCPFYEEVYFRGILFNGLKGAFKLPLAFIAAALIFSLCHGDSHGLLVLTGLGAVFSWLYQRSGSLWPSIFAHMLWNAGIAVYLFFLVYL